MNNPPAQKVPGMKKSWEENVMVKNLIWMHENQISMHENDISMHENYISMHKNEKFAPKVVMHEHFMHENFHFHA